MPNHLNPQKKLKMDVSLKTHAPMIIAIGINPTTTIISKDGNQFHTFN
jgi:hypothetical protein